MDDTRDIFRRFFGFPNRHPSAANIDGDDDPREDSGVNRPRGPFGGGRNDHGDDGLFTFFFGDRGKGLEDMFEHFHGDMWRQMETLHRQMEEMMKGFGSTDFPSSAFEPPRIQPAEPNLPNKDEKDGTNIFWFSTPTPFFKQERGKNPRDFMLKEGADDDEVAKAPAVPAPHSPDVRPKNRNIFSLPSWSRTQPLKTEDTDLDGKISEDKLRELIKKSPEELQPELHQPSVKRQPAFFSTGSSVHVTTIRGADGKVEQKKIVRDSSGHEENSVTRILGDKSYTVTTVTGEDGKQEKHESYQNMDEKDLSQFENQWNKPAVRQKPQEPGTVMLSPKAHADLGGQDKELFTRLFWGRTK